MARLATNPLMCGLICALHRERRGYLPTGRKELYDAALTMLLARRDRERGMGEAKEVEMGEEIQLELLQRLAYALVLSGRTEMDAEAAEGIVERCLPSVAATGDAPTVLRSLLLRSGLLRQPTAGIVDFVHRTFQDYLGARYAVEEGHLDVLASHAGDTQWEDVIRMAVAHARPRERATLIRHLLLWETPRLTLLALACLEHAAALDPAVRTEVERRAGALIPPRVPQHAKALAEAGPLVLELLPGPEGLTDEEALGVTITASALGSEEPEGALGVLRRFRRHKDRDVRRQLVHAWGGFPTEQYAAEVLDHLRREGLWVSCESAEQRAALALMRPWHRLALSGNHKAEEILAAVPAPEAVTAIHLLKNDELDDLGTLLAFRSLEVLRLNCPWAFGLDRLAPLPLVDLNCVEIASLRGLRALHSLRRLRVGQGLPDSHLTDVLPVDSPLEFLSLGALNSNSGLRGLEHWTGLRELRLGATGTGLTATDWQAVAALPNLTDLHLSKRIVGHPKLITLMPELASIETLRVYGLPGLESLAALARRLPGLRSVSLVGPQRLPNSPSRFAEQFPGVQVDLVED